MKYWLSTIILSLFFQSHITFLKAQNAKEILQKVEDKSRGKSAHMELNIKIERKKWTREMDLKSWSKGTTYFMVYIASPAKEKGNVTLKRNKEVWSWVPSIERTIKLPPSMMMQSWMGTDFTNDDLVKQSSIIEDYEHTILKDSIVDEMNCWQIQLDPKPDAPVVWGRIILFIEKKEFMQLLAIYYDEDLEKVNIMHSTEPQLFDGKLLPSKMTMTPINDEGNKTTLHYKKIEFDVALEEDFFSIQNISRVK